VNTNEKAFVKIVERYYAKEGRHDLPWRLTQDPYKITVSEIMLQQTQVSRVLEKYKEFLRAFPTVRSLAKAPLADVLRVWSGLGYNRRAKFLHQMAQAVVTEYKGKFPATIEGLQSLPGIGPYTAGAIYAFAYDKAYPVIETNIRTVYLHHFFADKIGVSDQELFPTIEATLQKMHPREWYWALMDYGSYLKSTGIKNNAKSKHYTKQSKFEGSKRQMRGAIMRELLKGPKTVVQIAKAIDKEKGRVEEVLVDLIRERMVTRKINIYSIISV
jgi:A/G-specific adenine glycosylase